MRKSQIQINRNYLTFSWKLLVSSLIISCLAVLCGKFLISDSHLTKDKSWAADADSSGWYLATKDAESKFNIPHCDIEKRSILDVTSEEFEQKYKLKKPLIFTFPNGAQDWTSSIKWSRRSLKKKYGHWFVQTGNALEIVRHGGNGNLKMYFERFVDDDMNKTNSRGEPLYIFDRYFYKDSDLSASMKVPKILKFKTYKDDSLFFLGSTGSGVSFHKHADAWNAVVFGKKRWFIYPPEKSPPGGIPLGFTILEWFNSIYPKLDESNRPLECIQEAGEIFYLPESFYHGTINIGDTVAIGMQKKEPVTEIEKLFYEELKYQSEIHQVKHQASQLTDYQKNYMINKQTQIHESLLKLLPGNAEVHLKLSESYSLAGRINEAFTHSTKATELDPLFVVAHLAIANQFFKLGKNSEAEKTFQKAMQLNPRLWDIYAQYGTFLIDTHHTKKAIKIFQKGIELEPNMTAFWYHLMRAQIELGDTEGAKMSSQHMEQLNAQS